MTSKRIRQQREHATYSELAQEALWSLIAVDAAERTEVKVFRRDVLAGELIDAAKIGQWVDRQIEVEKKNGGEFATMNGRVIELQFPGTGQLPESRIEIRAWGLLHNLWGLAHTLEMAYGWQPAQATAFILSGVTPVIEPVIVKLHKRSAYPRLSRIVMEIDPSLGPREVLEQYRAARRKIVKNRPRTIAPRSALLVQFYCKHYGKGLSWREQMNLWNAKYKSAYRFGAESNFGKQVKNSVRSLLMADFRPWKKGIK